MKMALILKQLVQGYSWVFNEQRDPRTDQFYLMSSPFQPLLIGLTYLFLIYKVLPEFMKNCRPFKLETTLILFNVSQVIVNSYIFYHAFLETFKLDWYCASIDFSETPHNMFILKMCYVYFLTKLADLLDTIFFVLRGKTSQVTFLHVYHHFFMIIFSWVGVRFLAGGHTIFFGLANSFVHTVMYFYYLLTAWKPEYKASIWWKKYITQLQLVQFVFLFFIFGQVIFYPECTFPKSIAYLCVSQNLLMMALFGNFYWKTYIKPLKQHNKVK